MRCKTLVLATGLAAGGLSSCVPAFADTTASPSAKRSSGKTHDKSSRHAAPGGPEEIRVVATPHALAAHTIDATTRALQNVPQAATHVEARELKAEHATSLPQAVRLLPTVQLNINNPRNTVVDIRGLGAAGNSATDGIEGGVAVYVDGVYRARPATVLTDLPGLNGITVLRGPDGTEGGVTATAGAIELTTEAPDLTERHVSAETGAGNYAYNRWGLGVSDPLIPNKLAVRLDILGYGYDGWVKNLSGGGELNGETDRSVRAQILSHPTDALTIRLIADYSHLRENCCSAGVYRVDTTKNNGAVIAGNLYQEAAWAGYTPVAPSSAPYTQDRNALAAADQEDEGLSSQVDWQRGNLTLTSITAYRWWNWYPHNDGDINGVDVEPDNNTRVNEQEFTQEFRLSQSLGHLVDYRVGAFTMWQQDNVPAVTTYGSDAGAWFGYGTSSSPVSGVSAAQASSLLDGFSSRSLGMVTTDEYAAYADATWHLAPRLDLVTGIRGNYDAKTGDYQSWEVLPADASVASVPLSTAESVWSKYGSVLRYSAHMDNGFATGQAALRYRITDDWMVYGRYAHGGKSGGLNLTGFSAAVLASGAESPNVSKETDDAFEIGSKVNLLQNRLLLSGALYQTDDHNYQVTAVQDYQGTLESYLSTAPEVRVRGAEADLHFSPLPNLVTSFSGSYNDAQFLSYNTTAPPEIATTGLYSLDHTQLPFVPRWALSAAAEYSHGVGRVWTYLVDGYLGASYNYHTRMNTSANNAAVAWVPGYGTLNLHFGFRDHQGRWDLSGFVNNATDERVPYLIQQGSTASGNGAWYAYVTEPINFGFIARVNF